MTTVTGWLLLLLSCAGPDPRGPAPSTDGEPDPGPTEPTGLPPATSPTGEITFPGPTGGTGATGGLASTGLTDLTGLTGLPSPTGASAHTGLGPELPPSCDAGTEAWVRRVLPMVWGRKPHGAAEVAYWAQAADRYGRDTVVRALARDRQYLGWFKEWFTDALEVARIGVRSDAECYERPLLAEHDGSLAAFVKDHGPHEGPYGSPFTMADVIVDALVADDVSVLYQAHLFARLDEPLPQAANVAPEEVEEQRRIDFGEGVYRTYLSRSLDCLPCHNGEWSTTDHADPALDRSWPLPGLLEQALMGSSAGLPTEEAYSVFRTEGVVVDAGGLRPWGMDEACGRVVFPDEVPTVDFLGQSAGTFGEPLDSTDSVYTVEQLLVQGTTSLEGAGLTVASDGTVAADQAFAYLLGATIADRVWQLATGERLVVAHGLPRNAEQLARLQSLTEPFVVGHYSLVELLVAVATDERLNAGVPASCASDPYGMAPVFDPWVVDELDPAKRGNGPGDLVHRLHARSLLRSVHVNLGWRRYDPWPDEAAAEGRDDARFQTSVGLFLSATSPGHDVVGLQDVLAFEARYGACSSDPPEGADDVVTRLLDAAETTAGATVGDVARALTDRVLGEAIDAETEPLVEAVLGASLTDPVPAGDPAFEGAVRRLCGTLLLTPQAQLVVDPTPSGPVPSLALDQEEDCALVAERMTEVGAPMTCVGTVLQ